MANDTKTRAAQVIRTDDKISGTVRFYDRRVDDVKLAYIGQVDVSQLEQAAIQRAAVHGVTQNIMDSSNKLDGDARVSFIRSACEQAQQGIWISAPSQLDPIKVRENAIKAMMAFGLTAEAAAKLVDSAKDQAE